MYRFEQKIIIWQPPLPRYPPPTNNFLFDDDPGIMSEVETASTGFRRGGKQRSSLPVVRTPSKTLERPLGMLIDLVILYYMSIWRNRFQITKIKDTNLIQTMHSITPYHLHHKCNKFKLQFPENIFNIRVLLDIKLKAINYILIWIFRILYFCWYRIFYQYSSQLNIAPLSN